MEGCDMDLIKRNSKGLGLLVDLGWDRFLFSSAIFAALGVGALLIA